VSREDELWLADMLDASLTIASWASGMTLETFVADRMLFDAVVRNYEVLGEAAKNVAPGTRALDPEIPWQSLAGFRDVVAHQYFRIEPAIVWEGIETLIPELVIRLEELITRLQAP
jgi:uncharacterized protein with HEPN domain